MALRAAPRHRGPRNRRAPTVTRPGRTAAEPITPARCTGSRSAGTGTADTAPTVPAPP
ncbi:predicted protein [Streptomyces viridosporus ATCC 14672]|uniref:Predicted protein n=1 Tax=Streptomyces viridosporus (strain ATCC 14672 / DSM 40746 / JCM 4963 / KCTC 9882 / NRRL B-12104 / FH 1290) TaxID=566461 RepID=D6A2N2_STRV1|nr:predicted protein [Streptomyces viridosporus ATCC 14672]